MANATLVFDILTKYKDAGAAAAARDVDGLGKSSSRTAAKLKQVGVAAAFGLAAGVAIAGRALIGATKAAIEDEAAQKRLSLALKNNAGATDGQIASTEAWISAQGKALGVTDDELRPALARLVTATHDVGKAQQLASLAMDVSAGTGKSLKSVTEALMKAQNGSVSGLSRLGVKTKDAAGETLSFEAVTRKMAKTFEGQAAKGANTLEGKMRRLSVTWDEAKETVGAKLIPVLTRLSEWVLSKGIPAISRFATEMRSGGGAAGVLRSAIKIVGDAAVSAGKFLNDHRGVVVALIAGYTAYRVVLLGTAAVQSAVAVATGVMTVASKAASVATKVWAAGQWLLNAALTANPIGLIVVGIAALIAVVVLVATKTNFFQKTWEIAWRGIKAAFSVVFDFIKSHWKLILGILTGPVGIAVLVIARNWDKIKAGAGRVIDWVKSHWRTLVAILTGPFGIAVLAIARNWDRIKTGAGAVKDFIVTKFNAVVDFFKSMPGRIASAAASAFDGLKSAFRSAVNFIISGWNNLSFGIPGFDPPGPGKFPGFTVGTPNIPMLANGARNFAGGLAIVGERGPELVGLPRGSNVYSNRDSRAMVAGGRSDNLGVIEVVVRYPDGREVQRQLLEVKRKTGRSLGLA